jgi:anti-anti-sigma factor
VSVLVVAGRVSAGDLPRLCARLQACVAAAADGVVVCDVRGLANADAVALDLLARLQLAARRQGGRIRLRGASRELRDLLAFTGLSAVLPLEMCVSLVEPRGEPEQREEALRVEERVDRHDPPV